MEDMERKKIEMQLWVLKLMAMTLGSIMGSVVVVMMVGLFVPNTVIDNNEIFKIIGPAFSMIVGAFVGSFATMMGMKTEALNPNAKLDPLGTADYVKTAQAESIEADTEIKLMAAVDKYRASDEDHGPF